MDEEHLAGHGGDRRRALLGGRAPHDVVGDGAAEGGREAAAVAAVDDLDAARLDGRVVERRPDLELRVAVEPPEAPAVLCQGSSVPPRALFEKSVAR